MQRSETIAVPPGAPRIAFYLDDLGGGGVQRMTLVLAGEFARHGFPTDVLVNETTGEFRDRVPPGVRVIELAPAAPTLGCVHALRADPPLGMYLAHRLVLDWRRTRRLLDRIPPLVRHLAAEPTACLVSATPRINIIAAIAARAESSGTRVILTERNSILAKLEKGRWRELVPVMKRAYRLADHVVAVSEDLAREVAAALDLPGGVLAIHNPVVGADLEQQAAAPLDDPWFAPGAPPVVLGAGRLSTQKDFESLVRAFAIVRRERPCRLLILGKERDAKRDVARREALLAIAREEGVADDVRLPGFVANPFPYMARAALFALSSRDEGLPGVLIQAMACGTPVVSTDCPTGPREILEGGRFGPLVPVGDAKALAEAIRATLDAPPARETMVARARCFSVERAFARYRSLALEGRDFAAFSA